MKSRAARKPEASSVVAELGLVSSGGRVGLCHDLSVDSTQDPRHHRSPRVRSERSAFDEERSSAEAIKKVELVTIVTESSIVQEVENCCKDATNEVPQIDLSHQP